VISGDAVSVDVDAGTATLEISNLPQKDYHDFENAMVGNGPKPVPGMVSFKVQWTGDGTVNHFDNAEQKFRGDFQYAMAQMDFTGMTTQFLFESAPLETSTTDGAQIGHESNGSFY
jgi:hypothetical protein